MSAIVQKLLLASSDAQVNWNYCTVLRGDPMSYLLARGAQASGLSQGDFVNHR